jgi:hypothetical protein
MNSTKTPGFTAEASLCKAARRYQKRIDLFSRADGRIYQSQQVTPWPVDVVDIGDLDTESPRTYGTVSPGNEDTFVACMKNCLAGNWHPTYAACMRTCCRLVTGYQSCVIA